MTDRELRSHRAETDPPEDLADFWGKTLAEAAQFPLAVTAEPVAETPLRTVSVYDVTFAGFGGQPISAWYLVPRQVEPGTATIIEFIGYGGGRGLPHELLFWSAAGHPHLIMDSRGQGSSWRVGHTPDTGTAGAPRVPGFLTDGLTSREDYYYRRLYVDAVRAVDAAAQLPHSDPARLVTTGTSQGGALSLVTAALHGGVAAAMPNVPFLCDIRASARLAVTGPYPELVKWCRTHRERAESAFEVLSYFDVVDLVRSASCPVHFGVALLDETCPPQGVYGCFNAYPGPKEITVYPWNGHESGEAHHLADQHRWLRREAGLG
ncbi:acetylxylan esterase [Actinomadura sp. 9N215]|uniref:acetylxylan esterase n=1 Tax=Actinomadura sp. 9N215 TaxID=3375150 RepID=UPI00378C33E4